MNSTLENDGSRVTTIAFPGDVSCWQGVAKVKFLRYLKCSVRSFAHSGSRYLSPVSSQVELTLMTIK